MNAVMQALVEAGWHELAPDQDEHEVIATQGDLTLGVYRNGAGYWVSVSGTFHCETLDEVRVIARSVSTHPTHDHGPRYWMHRLVLAWRALTWRYKRAREIRLLAVQSRLLAMPPGSAEPAAMLRDATRFVDERRHAAPDTTPVRGSTR